MEFQPALGHPTLDSATRMAMSCIYSAVPDPPVYSAAPLSRAAASWISDDVDRISRLPEDILRNVVSRLSPKDAARTTVLSTHWRHLWHSTPLSLVDAYLRALGHPMLDSATRMAMSCIHSAVPDPPVYSAAPLSRAAASWISDGVDRTSRLPEDILRNVVFRLPPKDAARTTVLSTHWRRLWHSTPLSLVDAYLRALGHPMLDSATRMAMSCIYSAVPDPPVYSAAPLSRAAASWISDGVDRISRLPEDILRNVVSRLPPKDAARTTVLSTNWRRLWHSTPLSLVDAYLRPSARTYLRMDRAMVSLSVTSAVSHALAAHPGPLRCVHLTCTSMDAHLGEIACWSQLFAAKGVQELVFVNPPWLIDVPRVPATLFGCTSLTSLYLGVWNFPATTTLPRAATFPHLRELGLLYSVIQEQDLAFLLDKCPVLENLVIVASRSEVRLRVVSHSLRCVEVCASIMGELTVERFARLERLLLWEAWGTGSFSKMCCRIKIGHVPKLRVVGFLAPGMYVLEIGNTIIKAGTKASPSTMVPSVVTLGIHVKLGARNEARMLPSYLRCFPNVETLYIQSENADKLTAKLYLKSWDKDGPIECVQRHIKKVVFREFRGQKSELAFLKFIAERAQMLEKIVVVLTHGCSCYDRVGANLRTSMVPAKWASKDCKLMILKCPFDQEGTAWSYKGALDFSNGDPFDMESRFKPC